MRAVLSALLCLWLAMAPAWGAEEPFAGFDDYVIRVMRDCQVPGMAIAIVKDGDVVFSKGYGVRKLGTSMPVDDKTVFAIGSTSKAFTATLVGMMVDEKRMDWDGRAIDYLPQFRLYDPYVTREVTVRDLLSHRTGLPTTDWLWHGSPFNRDEILHRIRYQAPAHSFRSKYEYQNVMYLAAGQCAAAVGGETWDELIQKRLFQPLRMQSSSTSTKALAGTENVAAPHALIDEKLQSIDYRNIDNIAPAGSINSNISDMTAWLRLHLAGGKFGDKQLIGADTLQKTYEGNINMPPPKEYVPEDPQRFQFLQYGMGWVVQDIHGHRALWHTGGIDGMRALVGLLPDRNVGFVVLSNSEACDQAHTMGLAQRLFDAYLGLEPKDWCAIFWRGEERRREKEKEQFAKFNASRGKVSPPSLAAAAYAGAYRHEVLGDITIADEGGRLVLDWGPERKADLVHWNRDSYKVIWRDRYRENNALTFCLTPDGQVERLEIMDVAAFARKK